MNYARKHAIHVRTLVSDRWGGLSRRAAELLTEIFIKIKKEIFELNFRSGVLTNTQKSEEDCQTNIPDIAACKVTRAGNSNIHAESHGPKYCRIQHSSMTETSITHHIYASTCTIIRYNNTSTQTRGNPARFGLFRRSPERYLTKKIN
jgi:hypothetical protein